MDDYVRELDLPGVLALDRPTFPDERGFFRETLRLDALERALGHPFRPVQANHARSTRGTLRGIHVAPWNKCVYVVRGTVQVVLLDARPGSPAFGRHLSLRLGEENRLKLFVPAGLGNSYLVLSEEADYVYLTDAYWAPGRELGVAWDDPDLGIAWEAARPTLSERDRHNPRLRDLFPGLDRSGRPRPGVPLLGTSAA
jgi:dTDP-4-dehydrorhamnose 3,5-epimerase